MEPDPHTLVIVEDPMIANLIRTVLRRENFTVVITVTANAISMVRQPERFNGVLVTNTPEDFLELTDTVRLLYLSGAPNPEIQNLFRRCRVVRKPFSPSEILAALKELAEL
jgi:CheY-like chemotaxis protein